uniref:hypothetical protein n=1 Tax=Ningiella ruwaisensis TaxID=2364274 RepID=UPI00109F2545|nr:hypothetical protein [Ningiella ruwaisensis]
MISHTAGQLAKLKDKPRVFYTLEFQVGTTTYRFNNTDVVKVYLSQNYLPGFIDEMPEIEITAQPKTNDISIDFSDPEGVLINAFLGASWMNKPCKIRKHIHDSDDNQILVKSAFEGLLSEVKINTEKSELEVTASSIWADFEKTAGIKTNSKSQQRYYPTDTAFDHAAKAKEKVYWGKDAPSGTGSGRIGGGRIVIPNPRVNLV